MKILMVCAGGMSTGILMKKLKKYWAQQQMPLTIKAASLGEYKELADDYDLVLIGPQVAYRRNMIAQDTGKPCTIIASNDYAIGNCPVIYEQVREIYKEHPELNETSL